jgi:hypothetical protein
MTLKSAQHSLMAINVVFSSGSQPQALPRTLIDESSGSVVNLLMVTCSEHLKAFLIFLTDREMAELSYWVSLTDHRLGLSLCRFHRLSGSVQSRLLSLLRRAETCSKG